MNARRRLRKLAGRVGATLLILVALLALARAADEVTGQLTYDDRVHVKVLERPGSDRVAIQLVGFQNDGFVVGDFLGQKIRDIAETNIVLLQYAERGFDPDRMYRAVMDAVNRLHPKKLLIYGGSMGGQLGAVFADKYAHDGKPYGQIPLLLDCAPGNVDTLKLPMPRWVASHLRLFGGGPIMSHAKAPAIDAQWHEPERREPGITDADIQAYRQTFPDYPWPAMSDQAKFMTKFDPSRVDLSAVSMMRLITSAQMDGDPLVNDRLALQQWRSVYPNLHPVVDPDRARSSHNSVLDWPSFIAKEARDMFVLAA